MRASLGKSLGMCGNDRELCLAEAQVPWSQTIEAAEKHYDRSEDCKFTSFIGYEWTGAVYSGSNLHRNIIFNNSNVPFSPVSFLDAPSRQELWDALDQECSGDCDYVVIPHNSNLSNGFMFEEPNQEELFIQNIKEPLIEIFQHKGVQNVRLIQMNLYVLLNNCRIKISEPNLAMIYLRLQDLVMLEML